MCYENMNIILNVFLRVGFCKQNFSEAVCTAVIRKKRIFLLTDPVIKPNPAYGIYLRWHFCIWWQKAHKYLKRSIKKHTHTRQWAVYKLGTSYWKSYSLFVVSQSTPATFVFPTNKPYNFPNVNHLESEGGTCVSRAITLRIPAVCSHILLIRFA